MHGQYVKAKGVLLLTSLDTMLSDYSLILQDIEVILIIVQLTKDSSYRMLSTKRGCSTGYYPVMTFPYNTYLFGVTIRTVS